MVDKIRNLNRDL